MKKQVIITLLFTALIIAGCSQSAVESSKPTGDSSLSQTDSSSSNMNSVGSSTQDKISNSPNEKTNTNQTTAKTGTLQQTLKDIRIVLKDKGQLHLPQQVPLEKGKYISAIVKKQSSGYSITFKQTNTPVAVNDKTLAHVKTLAVVNAQNYASRAEAAKQITYHNFGPTDGAAVDLGHNITGYADAGAGTAGISWNEGRWTLAALSPTTDADKGRQLAREIVAYLEQHTLPIPHQYGTIQVYTDNRQSMVRWQDGDTLFELTGINDPIILLKVAVSMK
ncbi:hypothetical protein [Sporolactobacillus nakayamae]|uniref:Lipoprotein n=1 Tax=Sporolactobacillus nakayamae TaxID=269670 RepID=A0A1I2WFX3_9BACL|nr:hypothetical protein [Sporolactobacillus nakayamae]SFG98481.1 hypothetical protein SAMN02982927_03485 [Sporolactobacillus nakayamae]